LLGRRVTMLVDKQYAAGRYSVIWNGRDAAGSQVASGVYFYRLTSDQGIRQAKMTLLR
jgi:flagellar hook assembly protein FlgD